MAVTCCKWMMVLGMALGLAPAVEANDTTTDTAAGVEAKLDAIHQRCGEEYGFPHPVAECLRRKDAEFGAELSRSYDAVKRSLKGDLAALLVESQRSWLKYQEAGCALVKARAEPEGRGLAEVAGARCILRGTTDRLEELKGQIDD